MPGHDCWLPVPQVDKSDLELVESMANHSINSIKDDHSREHSSMHSTEPFPHGIPSGINFDNFDKVAVNVTGRDAGSFKPVQSFESLDLHEQLLDNIKKFGYTKPTPVQKHAISIISTKRDLMGCAQTGSGKTAAYLLPILHSIMMKNIRKSVRQPLCLIISPTRELTIQIYEEARKFAKGSSVKVGLAYGGRSLREQAVKFSGCHILVATPGRLIDLLDDKLIVSLDLLECLVLDEADRMLDMGFKSEIEKIAKHPTLSKDKVQMLMFSATFPDEIQVLAAAYLRDYIFLAVGIVGGASVDVVQEIIEMPKQKKREKLLELLDQYCNSSEEDRILIFCGSRIMTDFLASYLTETKIPATSIHGDRYQREREQALNEFRTGKYRVLMATSVASRGLDIQGVTHVINYDLPKNIEDYVHRIGRTGRVGNPGKATSFFDPRFDVKLSGELIRILKQANQEIPDFLEAYDSKVDDSFDGFGGIDIRDGVDDGWQQEQNESW